MQHCPARRRRKGQSRDKGRARASWRQRSHQAGDWSCCPRLRPAGQSPRTRPDRLCCSSPSCPHHNSPYMRAARSCMRRSVGGSSFVASALAARSGSNTARLAAQTKVGGAVSPSALSPSAQVVSFSRTSSLPTDSSLCSPLRRLCSRTRWRSVSWPAV
eukprot:SAG31_NODE_529_length_14420_cov_20.000140_8_plen_159_part_00